MDWLINTGQLSHFKQQDNKTAPHNAAQCSGVFELRRLTHTHILLAAGFQQQRQLMCEDTYDSASSRRRGRVFLCVRCRWPSRCAFRHSSMCTVFMNTDFTAYLSFY